MKIGGEPAKSNPSLNPNKYSARPEPSLTIVAGPNGAGKSTFARTALKDTLYINGDEIKHKAQEEGFHIDQFSLRIHIRELVNSYARERKSFSLESNLVSYYSYDIVKDLSAKGYFTQLLYFGVEKLQTLNDRIAERVKFGQHYVSPHDVASRYHDPLSKLPVNLKPFNEASLIDNGLACCWRAIKTYALSHVIK